MMYSYVAFLCPFSVCATASYLVASIHALTTTNQPTNSLGIRVIVLVNQIVSKFCPTCRLGHCPSNLQLCSIGHNCNSRKRTVSPTGPFNILSLTNYSWDQRAQVLRTDQSANRRCSPGPTQPTFRKNIRLNSRYSIEWKAWPGVMQCKKILVRYGNTIECANYKRLLFRERRNPPPAQPSYPIDGRTLPLPPLRQVSRT